MLSGFEDVFVGMVSVALGLFLVVVAARNADWYYQVRTARFLEARLGRAGARWVHGTLGCVLITLGVAIALGWRWPLWS